MDNKKEEEELKLAKSLNLIKMGVELYSILTKLDMHLTKMYSIIPHQKFQSGGTFAGEQQDTDKIDECDLKTSSKALSLLKKIQEKGDD